jgi:hypothetical protein
MSVEQVHIDFKNFKLNEYHDELLKILSLNKSI